MKEAQKCNNNSNNNNYDNNATECQSRHFQLLVAYAACIPLILTENGPIFTSMK